MSPNKTWGIRRLGFQDFGDNLSGRGGGVRLRCAAFFDSLKPGCEIGRFRADQIGRFRADLRIRDVARKIRRIRKIRILGFR